MTKANAPHIPTLAIIPAFNEEEALPYALRDLATHCSWVDVLVINDGSRDRTSEVARSHGAQVAELPFNMGIGAALRTGFRYAERMGYQQAFQFDADGQHEAATVAALLEPLQSGADLVIGSRFNEAVVGHYRVGATRGIAMSLLRRALRTMTGVKLTDTSSGLRGFSRRMIQVFAAEYPRDYMDSVEAIMIAARHEMRLVEVPVTMQERVAGTASNRSFKLAYNYLRLLLVLAAGASLRTRQSRHTAAT